MRAILPFARRKLSFVLSIAAATVVGGAATAIVSASIPDNSGVIHACYTTGLLAKTKIIDSPSQTCTGNETAISWNQQGPKGDTGPQGPAGTSGGGTTGYAHIAGTYDGRAITEVHLDTARSMNVTSVQFIPNPGFGTFDACLTVSFEPKNIMVTNARFTPRQAVRNAGLNPENNGWSSALANEVCGQTGNAFVGYLAESTFVTFQ